MAGLRKLMELEEVEIGLPQEPSPTVKEFNATVAAAFGCGSND
jgi:hypothetical protein